MAFDAARLAPGLNDRFWQLCSIRYGYADPIIGSGNSFHEILVPAWIRICGSAIPAVYYLLYYLPGTHTITLPRSWLCLCFCMTVTSQSVRTNTSILSLNHHLAFPYISPTRADSRDSMSQISDNSLSFLHFRPLSTSMRKGWKEWLYKSHCLVGPRGKSWESCYICCARGLWWFARYFYEGNPWNDNRVSQTYSE